MTSVPTEADVLNIATRWDVTPEGAPFSTHSSTLLAGTRDGAPVMLKLTNEPDERMGAAVLAWWQGQGAVSVLEYEAGSLLMERPTGLDSLLQRALEGEDDFAVATLCRTAQALHTDQPSDPPPTPDLATWFSALLTSENPQPEIVTGQRIAHRLLSSERDRVILHGDIHHRNVLDSGDGRWLAIDPKGIVGERTFDYCNIFRNPTESIATDRARFVDRVERIVFLAELDRHRLLAWIASFCALSLAWDYYPEGSPDADRTVFRFALDRLNEIR
jgi:streptomycin 6-kinase